MANGLEWHNRVLRLALRPSCLAAPADAVSNLLQSYVGKRDSELNGIVLKYKDVKILNDFGVIRQDDADIYLDVQTQFLIFKPEIGSVLEGTVNRKYQTHLSVLTHKTFNIVIPRPNDDLNESWKGDDIKVGDNILYRITASDLLGSLPYIRGELDT